MADQPQQVEAVPVEDEQGAAAPWDDQTDSFISDIDDTVSSKYNVSLRVLLTAPGQYENTTGILETIRKIQADVEEYFEKLVEDLGPEKEELTKEMEALDSLYTKLDQAISSKAAVARVPYFKPIDVDTGDNTTETITVDQYNNNLDAAIGKLINISTYIANLSSTYKKYNLGSWLFSGPKDYVLEVNRPESMVITVEDAQQLINNGLNDAGEALASLNAVK